MGHDPELSAGQTYYLPSAGVIELANQLRENPPKGGFIFNAAPQPYRDQPPRSLVPEVLKCASGIFLCRFRASAVQFTERRTIAPRLIPKHGPPRSNGSGAPIELSAGGFLFVATDRMRSSATQPKGASARGVESGVRIQTKQGPGCAVQVLPCPRRGAYSRG